MIITIMKTLFAFPVEASACAGADPQPSNQPTACDNGDHDDYYDDCDEYYDDYYDDFCYE